LAFIAFIFFLVECDSETGETDPQGFAEIDSSTRGHRDADQRDEGDTPDHGREDGVIRMSATRG